MVQCDGTEERQMKTTIISILVLLLPVIASGEELVFVQNWNLKYRVEDGRIYDKNWQLKGRRRGSRAGSGNGNMVFLYDLKCVAQNPQSRITAPFLP